MRSRKNSTLVMLNRFEKTIDDARLPVWHYIEFQTQLMKLLARSESSLMQNLSDFYHLELFKRTQEDTFSMAVDWPLKSKNKTIHINTYFDSSSKCYYFDFAYLGATFLKFHNKDDRTLIIERMKNTSKKIFLEISEIESIRQTMLLFVAADAVIASPDEKMQARKSNFPNQLTNKSPSFTTKEFSSLVGHYAYFDFTSRMFGIARHWRKKENSYSFRLNWENQQHMTTVLKVKFNFAKPFHAAGVETAAFSWIMPETGLLKLPEYADYDICANQLYNTVQVFAGQKKTNILNLWSTSDGQCGEVRDVAKSKTMSGNDVLNFFQYLNLLLRVHRFFIYDESSLEEGDIKIPLRLFLALVIGETWYQKKLGAELFQCEEFETNELPVTQNAEKREQALTELNNLSLNDFYQVLSQTDQASLLKLVTEHWPAAVVCTRRSPRLLELPGPVEKKQFFSQDAVLHDLVTMVYNDSRNKRVITPDLKILNSLLQRDIDRIHPSTQLKKNLSQKWVASRVKQLLGGSIFWTVAAPALTHSQPLSMVKPRKNGCFND